MPYLLDTNILYRLRLEKDRLSDRVIALLDTPEEAVYYSVVSPWELSIKHGKGKLPLPKGFFDTLPKIGFDCIPVEERHIAILRELPRLHGDPFDRVLVAQAKAERLVLITSDKRLAAYPIETIIVTG